MVLGKNIVISGIFWSAIDRIAVVGIQLLFEIIIARFLLPADYGLIGMVAVFMSIAQAFIDGGFMNALIQKQDRTEIDFSTIFYSSLVLSFFLYTVLYLISPLIASFYQVPELTKIVKILGLNIIFNSIALVYRAKLSISMDFKLQAKLSVLSVLISGIIGLYLALNNFGVWALVMQSICLYGLNTIFLILNLRWKPLFKFSYNSFKTLFGFGSKILAAGIIQAIYSNLYSLIIGKVFKSKELGLYSKSSQFTLYPSSMITNMLQRVLFPYLSKYQKDDSKLFDLNKQYYTIIAMIFFPIFVGLSILAKPFVILLLSNSWIEIVPLIRVLSIAFLFYPFINVNMYIFQIKGMSSRFLIIEIATKITGIIILLITLKYGVYIMCVGLLFQHMIQLLITSYFSDIAMNSKKFSQIKVLFPLVVFSVLISFLVFSLIQKFEFPLTQLFIGGLTLLLSYLVYYYFAMKKTVLSFLDLIKR